MALRRAFLGLALWLSCGLAAIADTARLVKAEYAEPTGRYDHGILGDAVEWGALVLSVDGSDGTHKRLILRLPESRVFEDLAPRVITDETGAVMAMVVETDLELGARLALYDAAGLVDATPFIGRTHRWLAPVGAADLDGDGLIEIAYVEKPHLSKELKIWRLSGRKLRFVTALGGLTNHRIGEDVISSGVRTCDGAPELITADANWQGLMATRLEGGRLSTRKIGAWQGTKGLKAALACAL